MRLLDAKAVQINKTVRFKEFFDVDTPPYAILSHTWGQDEVTFHGLRSGLGEGTEGLKKIKECCAQAVVDGYAWVWIDTCCIDKSSSAELSEAINSMFKWYSNSAVCYAYLADVPSMRLESISAAPFLKTEPFGRSRWFSRAWTLQELIAPRKLEFYSRDWGLIGSKDRMLRELSEITTIHQDALMGDLRKFSVAQKLSWASKRQATRSEDTAYCLLGILGVNMPLLYGEGERAFIRLQEAFLSISDDQSLFAWQNLGPGILHNIGYTGLLAQSPAQFAKAGNIVPFKDGQPTEPFTMTNKGLRIHIPLIHNYQQSSASVALLDCYFQRDYSGPIGIQLAQVADDLGGPSVSKRRVEFGNQYSRVLTSPPATIPLSHIYSAVDQTVYVSHHPPRATGGLTPVVYTFVVPSKVFFTFDHDFCLTEVFPSPCWNKGESTVSLCAGGDATLLYECLAEPSQRFIIMLLVCRQKFHGSYVQRKFEVDYCYHFMNDTQPLKDIHKTMGCVQDGSSHRCPKYGTESFEIVLHRRRFGISIKMEDMVIMGQRMYPIDIKVKHGVRSTDKGIMSNLIVSEQKA